MDSTGTFLMPPANSTIAPDVDSVFYFVFYLSIIFFAIVVVGSVVFPIMYRRKGKRELTSGVDHSVPLELAWTIIPTILVLVIFVWGFKDFMRMQIIPKDSIEISATGQKWSWAFNYENGISETNRLVVPVNKPVKLLLSSRDVLHSLYIPDFRVKMDVLPNRYTALWFEATRTGESNLFCTEYCGTSHSEMIGKVVVMEEDEYAKWLEASANPAAGLTTEEYGAKLFTSKACMTCHSLDGSAGVGPTFKGLFGSQEKLMSGETVTVDENYVRESILNPMTKVTAGYQPVMPSYQGQLKDEEINALIAYMKTLK